MHKKILKRILAMYDVPIIQNSLRGLYVEVMIAELLGSGWTHVGTDWAGWDLEHESGLRVEVKQSTREQTWGPVKSAPRFNISIARGHYPDGITYVENTSGMRLADVYVFAWHDGTDQRDHEQWQFFVVSSRELPVDQATIGLNALRQYTAPTTASQLKHVIEVNLRN